MHVCLLDPGCCAAYLQTLIRHWKFLHLQTISLYAGWETWGSFTRLNNCWPYFKPPLSKDVVRWWAYKKVFIHFHELVPLVSLACTVSAAASVTCQYCISAGARLLQWDINRTTTEVSKQQHHMQPQAHPLYLQYDSYIHIHNAQSMQQKMASSVSLYNWLQDSPWS